MLKVSRLLLPLGFVSVVAFGNPIAVPPKPVKQWERCLASVDDTGAAISCAVGYQMKPAKKPEFFVIKVPVFWPKGEAFKEEDFLKKCHPMLEWNEQLLRPVRIQNQEASQDLKVPESMSLIFCFFEMKIAAEAQTTSLVASYWQPAGAEGIPYVPLFEDAKKERDESLFTFTAFPVGTQTLSLASKHAGKTTVLKTRITVIPQDKEEIIIRCEGADRGNP